MTIPNDKKLHFLCCLCIVSILFHAIGYWSVIIALIASFGKEIYDEHNGGVFSWKDIYADIAGIATGCVAMALINLIGKLI